MQTNIIYNTDCLTGLRNLADDSIDCCVTSPPYFNLRDYGVSGQIGLENTPEEYIDRLVEVFREVRRVLKPAGTLWLNIGDSYASSGKGATNYPDNAMKCKQGTNRGTDGCLATVKRFAGYKRKDLIGIPWLLAFALRADGWYLRQDIIWSKPNPMPESVTDRCTKAHEYVFLLSKSARYYFDAAAIKEPANGWNGSKFEDGKNLINHPNVGKNRMRKPAGWDTGKGGHGAYHRSGRAKTIEYADMPGAETRNKRSVWVVPPQPCKESHFATFPEALIAPCILAGCPEHGIILDPFMGSGTTAVVARKHARRYIGFELNSEYIEIADKRLKKELGLFV